MNGTKIGGVIIGVLVTLSGGTFALQGLGKLGTGSPMDNNASWIYIGSFLLLVGVVLVLFSLGVFAGVRKSNIKI
ncbi:MAG: hypothetical protein PXY39_02345 [archaeon]|nr:hypothetical protein [archaeon]